MVRRVPVGLEAAAAGRLVPSAAEARQGAAPGQPDQVTSVRVPQGGEETGDWAGGKGAQEVIRRQCSVCSAAGCPESREKMEDMLWYKSVDQVAMPW